MLDVEMKAEDKKFVSFETYASLNIKTKDLFCNTLIVLI